MVSRMIKVKVSVISQSLRPRLMTLTETLVIVDFTKTESHNHTYYILLYITIIIHNCF